MTETPDLADANFDDDEHPTKLNRRTRAYLYRIAVAVAVVLVLVGYATETVAIAGLGVASAIFGDVLAIRFTSTKPA